MLDCSLCTRFTVFFHSFPSSGRDFLWTYLCAIEGDILGMRYQFLKEFICVLFLNDEPGCFDDVVCIVD